MTDTHDSWDGHFDDDGARCPFCGEVDDFAGDHPSGLQRDGDSTEVDCGNCGEPFEVTMCISTSYATKPLFIGPKLNHAHWYAVRQEMRARGELPPLLSTVAQYDLAEVPR